MVWGLGANNPRLPDLDALFPPKPTNSSTPVHILCEFAPIKHGRTPLSRVYADVPQYIPHDTTVVQTIFRKARDDYVRYANPPADILDRVDQYIGCADWSKGVARIRCDDCGHSYFRPFSCKAFHLCPSCDQKRTLLYAEYLAEDLLLDLPHRQFVFTIPKILRPYFKNNRRLFGEVSRLIFGILSNFFSLAAGQALQCACVVSYQSFGEFGRFHPHWHVLVLEGGFTTYDRFVYLPISSDEGMCKVWRNAILGTFLKKEFIDQNRATMIQSWAHSGFSAESETRLFTKADREALGQYVVRGAINKEQISYDSGTDIVSWKAAEKGFYKGKVETFHSFEFMDQLAAHIPPRRVQLVRRYGVYAGRVRSKWTDRPGIARLAPESWVTQHTHQEQKQDSETQTIKAELAAPDAWSRLRKKSWARLLQKIYEVNPFLCPKCGGTMQVVAVIEDPGELRKIIEWAAKNPETQEHVNSQARGPPVFAV